VSDPFGGIIDLVRNLLAGLGLGSATVKGARLVGRYKLGSIPVCETHLMREGLGLPWNKLLALHPLQDGRLEITVVQAPHDTDDSGAQPASRRTGDE
jgi:hypothetical protein